MTNPDRLPYVEAELNYLAPPAERPRYYAYEPGPSDPPPNMVHEPHLLPIHDMRPISHEIGLDSCGFALVEQRSAVRDFWDDDEVRAVYYPEAAEFIKQALGASRVFIFDHVQRRRVDGVDRRQAGMPRQPATRVHVDHTAKSGPQRVRDLLGGDAEELLRGRVQVINTWRRSAARCAMHRSRYVMRLALIPATSCPLTWSIATASARPTWSPTTRRIAGSMCRRCGPTRRCC